LARANTVGKINFGTQGRHNQNFDSAVSRIIQSNTYRDLSTVWVTPSPDCKLDLQVVFDSWLPLAMPMNQKIQRVGIGRGEVGKAYNAAVEMILRDSVKWKYMLTVEHDNLPPRDGLLKLYESIDKYDAVGGLYWMKGENGTPMIYGDPANGPDDFRPQPPRRDTLQPCNMPGMGFCLFNIDVFRKVPAPWFHTADVEDANTNSEFTQDGYFFRKAVTAGCKFAVDTRVKVGHIDLQTRQIW
jgi:hypothetical protein